MSISLLDKEIEISESNFLLDGRYRNTFPFIFKYSKFSGNEIRIPSFVLFQLIFSALVGRKFLLITVM